MRESSTYQAILNEGEAIGEARGRAIGQGTGRIEEARKTILTLGRKHFGELPPQMQASLDALTDVDTLDKIIERILDVET